MIINLYAAWGGFFLGCLAGAVPGLFFHDKDWLGGYGSWERRMIRLAHISLFGIGLLNISLALTSRAMGIDTGIKVPAVLLIVGACAMPLVCYLSAWKASFRHMFFIPAVSIMLGIGLFLWRILFR